MNGYVVTLLWVLGSLIVVNGALLIFLIVASIFSRKSRTDALPLQGYIDAKIIKATNVTKFPGMEYYEYESAS